MKAAINLDSLLKSTTYQGMTDEEIQAIIDYKLQALEKRLTDEFESRLQVREQSELYAATMSCAEQANRAFDRAMNLHVNYQNV